MSDDHVPEATDAARSADFVLRPKGSAVLGGVGSALFLLGAVTSLDAGPAFVMGLVLAAALLVVVLVRPFMRLTMTEITVHNPFRRHVIPWPAYEDVSSQWNLVIYAGDQAIKSWAIAAKIKRRTGSGVIGAFSSGAHKERLNETASAAPEPLPGSLPTSAGPAAVFVEQLYAEWQDLRQKGAVPPQSASATVCRRWDALDLALVIVPAVAWLVVLIRG